MYKNPYGASVYSQASQNVSPMKAVVMLYEGMIRLIRVAKKADEEGRFEDRFKAVEKASRVLIGLQGQLDFENGGDISPLLHEFYDNLFMRMMQINSRSGQEVADDVIEGLVELKNTWEEVQKQTDQSKVKPQSPVVPKADASKQPASYGSSGSIKSGAKGTAIVI